MLGGIKKVMRPRSIYNQVRLRLFVLAYHLGNFLRQAVLAAIVLQAVLQGAHAQPTPSTIVTLPNGEKYEFAGVTYGTNHAPEFDAGPLDSSQTNEWLLRVWFRLLGTNAPSTGGFQLISAALADQSGALAGKGDEYIFLRGGPLHFATFEAAPRRSKLLQFCIFQSDQRRQSYNEIGRVSFSNPYFGKFPE